MMARNLYAVWSKRLSTSWTRLAGRAILAVLWLLLSFSAFFCTETEAAVPSRDEIPGVYNSHPPVEIWFEGDTLVFGSIDCAYDPATGTAVSADGNIHVRVTKDSNGKVSIYATQFLKGYDPGPPPKDYEGDDWKAIPDQTVVYAGGKRGQKETANQNNEQEAEPAPPAPDSGHHGNDNVSDNQDHNVDNAGIGMNPGYFPDFDEDEPEDLPDSDAGKAAAALGTAIAGALLGTAGGAIGGAIGGVAGGAAGGGAAGSAASGAAGSTGNGYGGYGPNEGYYDPPQGGYDPNAGYYDQTQGDYGPNEGYYNQPQEGYDPSAGYYDQNREEYGPAEDSYSPEEGGYGPDEGGYGPDEGGYGPDEGGYGPDEGGYGPDEGGYGPDEGGYGPDEGGYGPDEGGYGPDEGGYGPDEGGYGPDEGTPDTGNDYDNDGENPADYEEISNETDYNSDEADEDSEAPAEDYEETTEDNEVPAEDYEEPAEDNEEPAEDYEAPVEDYEEPAEANEVDKQEEAAEAEEQPEPSEDTPSEPPAEDTPKETNLDNLAVADDGSIHVTAPTGEKLVYTRNADGSYNLPTRTETGEPLTYQDENGNWHTAEPMTLSQEEVIEGARWYKEHEQELVADRAAEDARQQAERERLARENAAWLEREHAINNQRSLYGLEVQKELKMMEQQQAKEMYMDKLHWKYDPVGKDLSDEELKTVVKREQIKNNIKGGLYEQEAAKWDNHLITAQEVKFGADQAVNAYGILTHNQAFATAYNACTNYTETMVDAKLNNKDTGKAFLKATIDTGLDALANKFESHGWHITGNAFSGAYKQVNDNVYNGRDAWDNTDTAAVYGGVMGTVSKGIAKLGELSQGTVLGKNIGGSSPDVDMNLSKPKPDMDVDTKGIRPTTIAERRLGQGQIHTNTPMSDADVKMSINEDVQAIRSMNDVRQLNKISTRMDTIEKANPRTYQNNAEYQKLSQQFETQRAKVSEDMVAVDRMNALQGETGTHLRQRYNQSAMAYENKVLQYRNESIAESTGLKTSQIGDFHASSNKDAIRAAGGPAAHDLDTSPNVKVETGTGKNKSVDFSQTDGDHHLVRGIYKAEHGRYPQTAAEYAEGQQLAQNRHFTNVSTQPGNTHEIKHNPEAYVGSGKGEVNKVLQPDKYGTPDKGTGALNEQTAIHKQRAPLEQHRQQYAEAQDLRNQLNTDKSLSAAEKTAMGQKIATLERQSANNHYEATRTTAKENGVIKGINDANETKGLTGGMSDDAKYIGEQAQLVREGKQTMATYKQIVKEKYGSEEKAQEILAHGFRDTNK